MLQIRQALAEIRGILRRLVAHGVDFVVSGGVAATLHGAEEATGDVDIVYSGNPDNLRKLAIALADMGAALRGHVGLGVTSATCP